MAYKAKTKLVEAGVYTLTYGKGRKKLTDTLRNTEDGWEVEGKPDWETFDRKAEAKEAWGDWAEQNYDLQDLKKPTTPAAPAIAPPPSFAPPSVDTGEPEPIEDFLFAADPFDPRYKYPSDHADPAKRNKLTPLGVLVEVDAWYQRDAQGRPSLAALKQGIKDCLNREIKLEPIEGTEDYDD